MSDEVKPPTCDQLYDTARPGDKCRKLELRWLHGETGTQYCEKHGRLLWAHAPGAFRRIE